MQNIRPACCAGTFYPKGRSELESAVDAMLPDRPVRRKPLAMIVPHAGYVYSGQVAAQAYSRLKGGGYRRVVVLGPAHRLWFRGIAIPAAMHCETPLGPVRVDREACISLPGIVQSEEAHRFEHSIEVQLPFLQRILGDFSLVPLLVGEVAPETVSEIIDRFIGKPETLVLVSSDLSHFLPYDEANALDGKTSEAILGLEPFIDHERACGATPINGLLLSARKLGIDAELLDLKNSGDTAGDKNRVVGYASFSFGEKA